MTIQLDMYQSIALAVIVLLIGKWIRTKVSFLSKYCIPAPVIGGVLFALITFILHEQKVLFFEFNETQKTFFMVLFFTTIGFNASAKILRKGGMKVIVFLGCAVLLVALQNFVAVGLSPVVGIDPLLGLMTGSTPMTGGHGTAAAVAPDIEARGIAGATSVAVAAATFGLVAGSMMGGPIANRLITKRKLKPSLESEQVVDEKLLEESFVDEEDCISPQGMAFAFFYVIIAAGMGIYITNYINSINPDFQFPIYMGPMLLAALARNLFDVFAPQHFPQKDIEVVGDISLNLFLALALVTLKLWELTALAGPLLILLLAQTALTYLYVNFVTFNLMGKNYDAAVMAAGHCGFGMGAVPNAMANMESVTQKFYPSKVAFFVVPIVGTLFIDFFNISIIATFVAKLATGL